MKPQFLFICLLICLSWQLFAQTNPLVGTWQVVSAKGTDADGKPMTLDGSQFVETKIITPTHYAIITQMKQGDSLVFEKAIAGRVQVEGSKYIEIPLHSSQANIGKAEFTYRTEGDKFIQKGVATHPNGQKNEYEIVFQKVKLPAQTNPAIGVWNQLTSSGVNAKGEKWSHTSATHIRFMTVSPTHYIIIRKKDNQFEDALAGTYRIEGGKFIPNWEFTSNPAPEDMKIEIVQRIEAGKLLWDGKMRDKAGTHTWHDVYEKVNGKTAKTASTK